MRKTLKLLKELLIIVLVVAAFAAKLAAQTYPVQVNTQIAPPFSPYLSDYSAVGAQRLMVNFLLKDPTLPEYRCKLRLTIEGVGITIRTKQSFVPQPLVLPGGGVPLLLYGEDLAEYFNPNNLDFNGITRGQYEKGAKLPDGVYRFTVEVLDYNRNTLVSNRGTTVAWIILNDPPLLNLPRTDTKVTILDPTNIAFTWTPRHTGSPNSAFTTEYIFKLVEIWPATRNPYDAFLSQQPLYEITTDFTQIIYGPAEPALIPGRKYAWQVQAKDVDGRDLFKNQGKSEIYVFQFGDALGAPESLSLQTANPTSLVVRWEQNVAGTGAVKYRVRYRPHNKRSQDAWYEEESTEQWRALPQLKPDTEYEVQVRAEQSSQMSEYCPVKVFKTALPGANEFVCKSDVSPPPIPEGAPALELGVSDTIHAGGFDVLVSEVTGTGGTYTGSGLAIVPWFQFAKVKVTFKGIGVNGQHWLTSGEIKSVWNPNSPFLLKSETKIDSVKGTKNGPVTLIVVETTTLIEISGAVIIAVNKNEDGDIEVQTSDGETKTLKKGESYSIVDEAGNGYVVDKKGDITKTTAEAARGAAERGDRNYTITLKFQKGAGKLGFDEKKYDALASYYQQLEDGTYISWKAVTSSTSDAVRAVVEGSGIEPGKIRFEVSGVPVAPMSVSNGAINLKVSGKAEGMVEELLAMYPSSTDTTKDDIIGKLNLVSYDKISRNVVIVPVNIQPGDLPGRFTESSIQQALDTIYGQAVAGWKVSIASTIPVTLDASFDDGESGLLTNYTGDMKKVINAYGSLQDKTYYLFLVNKPKSGTEAMGYMPRSKQAGFIFLDNHKGNIAKLTNTIAHELGHGAFNLKHTFSEFPALGKGSTQNLMDYTNGVGSALYKYQWDHVHDPQMVLSLFEDDEEGESANVILTEESTLEFLPGAILGESSVVCDSRMVLLGSNIVAEFDETTLKRINGQFNVSNNRLNSFKIGNDLYTPVELVLKKDNKYNGATSSYYFACWAKIKEAVKNQDPGITSYFLEDKDGGSHLVYKGIIGSPYVITLNSTNKCLGQRVIGNDLKCYEVKASDCTTSDSDGTGHEGSTNIVRDYTNEGVDLNDIKDLLAGNESIEDPIRGNIQTTHAILFLTSTKTLDADYKFVQNYEPKGDTIKLWIHKDANGKWFVKSAPNFDKVNGAFDRISSGYSFDLNKELSAMNYSAKELATALYKIADWLSSGIKYAYIPESWWNCDDKAKYDPPLYIKLVRIMLAPMATLMEQLAFKMDPTLEQKMKASGAEITFAAVAGLWDGFIGMFDALPQAVKMLTMSFADDPKAKDEYSKLSKLVDDQGGGFPGLCSVMWQGLKGQFDINKPCVFAHTVGEFGFTILAAVYTGGAAASTKVGQVIQSTFKVLDRLDVLGNAIGVAAKPVIKFTFRGATKVITVSTRAGLEIIECAVDGSKYTFKVLNAATKAFGEVDWSLVKEVVYYGLNGKTYKQKIWSSDAFDNYIYKIKEILKDEEGNVITNERNERIAVVENTNDPTDTKSIVIQEDGSESYDDLLDPHYGKPFYAIFPNPSDELVAKFNALTSTAKSDFLDDLSDLDLARKVAGKPELIDGWKLLGDIGSVLRKDPSALTKLLDDINFNPNLSNFLRSNPNKKAVWEMLHKTSYSADVNVLQYVDEIKSSPKLGRAANTAYLTTWRAKFPNLKGGEPGKYFNVHHAIERQVIESRWPGLFDELEIHSLENLRGISGELNVELHLKKIRNKWDEFYDQFPPGGPIPTRQQVLDYAKRIDDELGKYFSPPIRPLDY